MFPPRSPNRNESDRVRLRHMLDAPEKALLIAQESSRISLLAVMKDIEIIGEAPNKISPGLKETVPEIPWGDIVGMRNRLVHTYFDVEPALVGETVTRDLPALILQLRGILNRG